MSNDSSEEKSLPPSEKKLRESRKKGQFAKSQDVMSAALMIVLTLYLILAWPSILGAFARMFDAAGKSAARLGPDSWQVAARETWDAIASILLPIYALAVFALLVGSIVSNKGITFAIEPIKPDLKRIHPVEGFKKLFSLRNFIEFLKALVKSSILLGSLGFAAWLGIEAVMQAPLCGAACVPGIFARVAAPIVVGALALFFFSALIDVSIQKWLFTRDMRMTHSEFKREMKEIYGDPLIRRARKEMQRGGDEGSGGERASRYITSREPTIIIASSNQTAVALRYIPGETPAPVVLAKASGASAARLIESAYAGRIPVRNEPALAEELFRRARVEAFAPETLFRELARAISQGGNR